jgi:chromosome partitioning protein
MTGVRSCPYTGTVMRVIAVVANKGGVGKSTLAFQVAAELSLRGQRVLAVDADRQADLTRYARGPRIAGLGLDAVLADPSGPLDPRPYIGPVGERLELLGSSSRLSAVERRLSEAADGPFLLQRLLAGVAGEYDWAVIDTGHAEALVAAAIVAADALLMPTAASSPDADHAGEMLELAAEVRGQLGLPSASLLGRSLITVWRRQHNAVADAKIIEELRARFRDLVCPILIPHSSRVSEANAQRLTVRRHAEMYGTGRDLALRAVVRAYSEVTAFLMARATAPEPVADAETVAALRMEEADPARVAAALRRLKSRRGLDDDQLAEVLGRPVEWVRQTLAFGARHPEGEDRLTIRPRVRRTLAAVADPRWRS